MEIHKNLQAGMLCRKTLKLDHLMPTRSADQIPALSFSIHKQPPNRDT